MIKKLKAEISSIEHTISIIPKEDSFKDAVADLQLRVAAKKEQIRNMHPPGARLDAARAALARATLRKEEAKKALELAESTLLAADNEIARITDDVAYLEKQVATSPGGSSTDDVVKSLQQALIATIEFAEKTPGFHQAHIIQARAAADGLSAGFVKTFEAAAKIQEARVQYASRWKQRHSVKGPPRPSDVPVPDDMIDEENTEPVRVKGKSAAQERLITDYFRPNKAPRCVITNPTTMPAEPL